MIVFWQVVSKSVLHSVFWTAWTELLGRARGHPISLVSDSKDYKQSDTKRALAICLATWLNFCYRKFQICCHISHPSEFYTLSGSKFNLHWRILWLSLTFQMYSHAKFLDIQFYGTLSCWRGQEMYYTQERPHLIGIGNYLPAGSEVWKNVVYQAEDTVTAVRCRARFMAKKTQTCSSGWLWLT